MSKAGKILKLVRPKAERRVLPGLIAKVSSLVLKLRALDTNRATIHSRFDDLGLMKTKEGKDLAKAEDLLDKVLIIYGRLEIALKKASR